MTSESAVPDGFVPYSEPSPFLDRIGPLYEREDADGFALGLLVLDQHCNQRGFAHGGLLVTTLKIANARAEKAVVAALAPVCAEKFNAQPDVAAKRVVLNDTSSWKRRDLFPKEWVTLPDGSYPSSDLVDVCSDLILKPQTALKP
jgi:hypothetical protein